MTAALILGGADSIWDDASAALDLFQPDIVLAVNDIGTAWAGSLDHWCTLHPERMVAWRALRDRRGLPAAGVHVAHSDSYDGIDRATPYLWPGMTASGSSGLFAVKVALEAGADRVVLAGVPMSREGAHFFDALPWTDRDSFMSGWREAMPFIAGKVKSMSGWTRNTFGALTLDWLNG